MTEHSEQSPIVNPIETQSPRKTARDVVLELFPNIEEWKFGWNTDEYRTRKIREELKEQPELLSTVIQFTEDTFGKPFPHWEEGHEELTKAVIIAGELGPAPYALLRVAVIILDGHELIEEWDEKKKSILLDTALSFAINSERESRDRSERAKAYFGSPIHRRLDREESSSITKYKAAQQKLRAAFQAS